ncbi:MAG: outer membrane beta-barrel protein, partial [Pseudomonadota bacterium]
MKKLSHLSVLAAVLCAGSSAYADSGFLNRVNKPYISLNAGMNMVDNTDFNFSTTTNVENEYDDGYVITGEAGYNFGKFAFIDNVKLGFEIGYLQNEIDVHNIGGAAQAGSTGDLNTLTFLANMYHEFDTGTRFVPYYGVGVGIAMVEADGFGVSAAPTALD